MAIEYFWWLTFTAVEQRDTKGGSTVPSRILVEHDAMALFKPVFANLNGSTPIVWNTRCQFTQVVESKPNSTLFDHSDQVVEQRTVETFTKLLLCFEQVEQREQLLGRRFSMVI